MRARNTAGVDAGELVRGRSAITRAARAAHEAMLHDCQTGRMRPLKPRVTWIAAARTRRSTPECSVHAPTESVPSEALGDGSVREAEVIS